MEALISITYTSLSFYHALNAELAPGLAYVTIATIYLVAYHIHRTK